MTEPSLHFMRALAFSKMAQEMHKASDLRYRKPVPISVVSRQIMVARKQPNSALRQIMIDALGDDFQIEVM